MPSPLFSLIIPVYNVQAYIARCLESCIHQSFSDIEILVIDDCGSDESIAIVRTYAIRDCRISIIHNATNLGTLHSRMEGIKIARGAYVLFVDADDYLTPTACATLCPYLAKNPDIIHFKARYQGEQTAPLLANLAHKARYILPTQWSAKPLRDSEIAHNFFLKSKHFPKFTLWDKCYKTELLRESLLYLRHISTPICIVDDMVLFFVIASLAKSYTSTRKRLICYCLNHTSISQDARKKQRRIDEMRNAIEAFEILSKMLETRDSKQIAHTMSDHLRALIVLESRFDSCISTEGGGSTGFRESSATESNTATNATESSAFIAHAARHLTLLARFCVALLAHLALSRFSAAHTAHLALARFSMARLALPARLCRFSAVLGSFPYLCAYPYLYPKLWQTQALDPALTERANLSREVA